MGYPLKNPAINELYFYTLLTDIKLNFKDTRVLNNA